MISTTNQKPPFFRRFFRRFPKISEDALHQSEAMKIFVKLGLKGPTVLLRRIGTSYPTERAKYLFVV